MLAAKKWKGDILCEKKARSEDTIHNKMRERASSVRVRRGFWISSVLIMSTFEAEKSISGPEPGQKLQMNIYLLLKNV